MKIIFRQVACLVLFISSLSCTYASTINGDHSDSLTEEASIISSLPKEAREYHLKAAFLRYVAKFVEWPSESGGQGIINICILGQVPYYKGIDSINGKMIDEKQLKVFKIANLERIEEQCQILFVAKTEANNIENIIQVIQDKPVLGFGDMDHFAEKGGDMNFYIVNNRLSIMINPPAVEKSHLKISPRMLKLVTIVPPQG